MTPKQMYRAMRKWGISVVCLSENQWFAGTQLNAQHPFIFGDGGRIHRGHNPELAVKDYCNARNLEWDV